MANLIDAQRDNKYRELHAVAVEAVEAWGDPVFGPYDETIPAVDRLVHAMDALDCVLRGEPAPAKWMPEVCIEADPRRRARETCAGRPRAGSRTRPGRRPPLRHVRSASRRRLDLA